MSTAYVVLQAKLQPASNTAHAEFLARNTTGETWRADEGFGIGYHLFDADTGTLIVDGPRVQPERDVKPGETITVRMD
ncbi:MAG TPA: hypothetical protein VGZ73_07350, partial [Bryobacteraceae bacterium]|nr:hypothetical protein [Bryobacteraceae bacterium]